MRFPDWPKVMQPLLRQGEVVKCFAATSVDSRLLSDVCLAACILTNRTHVIAAIQDTVSKTFRIYDNDSNARQRGAFESRGKRAMHMNATLFAVMVHDSALSQHLGTRWGRADNECHPSAY